MAWTADSSDTDKVTDDLTKPSIPIFFGESVGINGDDNWTPIFNEIGGVEANWDELAITYGDEEELYVEIEDVDSVNKTAVVWVGDNTDSSWTVVSGTDRTGWIYYKDGNANTDHVGVIGSTVGEKVWDSYHEAVWHLADGTTLNPNDSTSNNKDGTVTGASATDGLIDGAALFSDDYIEVGTFGIFDGPDNYTISCIIRPTSVSAAGWIFHPRAERDLSLGVLNDNLFFIYYDGSDHGPETSVSINTTYVVSAVWDKTNSLMRLYTAGVQRATAATGTPNAVTDDSLIGSQNTGGSSDYAGWIDEMRISSVARAPAWIKANYYLQTDDLLYFGSEEILVVGAASLTAASVLAGEVIRIRPGLTALAADGTLSAATLRMRTSPISLTAASVLIAESGSLIVSAAALQAKGALAADGIVLLIGESSLTAESILSLAGATLATGEADLTAQGVLSPLLVALVIGQASFAAQGVVAALFSKGGLQYLVASLNAIGALAIEGEGLFIGQAPLIAESVLSFDPVRICTVSSPLDAASVLTSELVVLAIGQSGLTSIATLGAEGVRVRPSSAPLTAVGVLTVDGKGLLDIEGSLSAASLLAARGITVDVLIAALQSAGVLSSKGTILAIGQAPLTAESIATVQGSALSSAVAALQSAGVLSADGVILSIGQAGFDAAGIVFARFHDADAAYLSMVAAGSLGIEAYILADGSTSVDASGSLIVDAYILSVGEAVLAAASVLAADAVYFAVGEADLTAQGTVAPNAVAFHIGQAALDQASVVVASLIRVKHVSGAFDAAGVLVVDGAIIKAVSALLTAQVTLTCAGLSFVAKQFYYAGTLTPGDVLVIDTDTMTVKLNGVNVRVDFSGEFFKLFVGDQELEYMDYEGSRTALVSVDYKDRWM